MADKKLKAKIALSPSEALSNPTEVGKHIEHQVDKMQREFVTKGGTTTAPGRNIASSARQTFNIENPKDLGQIKTQTGREFATKGGTTTAPGRNIANTARKITGPKVTPSVVTSSVKVSSFDNDLGVIKNPSKIKNLAIKAMEKLSTVAKSTGTMTVPGKAIAVAESTAAEAVAPKVGNIASKVGKVARTIGTVNKVSGKIGRLGLKGALAAAAIDGVISIGELAKEVSEVSSARKHQELHAQAAKKAGFSVARPKLTGWDKTIGIPLGLESTMRKADVRVFKPEESLAQKAKKRK